MGDENKEQELNTVMVIGAHPDDPEFGCAATICKWASMGRDIHYVLLTSGDKGCHDPAVHPGQVAAQREDEQRAAARELGVRSVRFLHYPDGMLEYTMDLRRQLCELVRTLTPDIVLAIDPWRRYQLHPDHRVAGQAALDAVWAAREWYIFPEQLIDREPWRVKEVYLYWTDDADYWEDVTESMDKRIAALMHHDSQVNGRMDRIEERIRKTAAQVGEPHGIAYAEGFKRITLS
ncbi:MAG TPA: PIG-L family deacetylase [Chloroflexi bacterium]|jgi:LmbE family N-acetylglucosaminyl deacetylase|nr:PIG-L family deacetylase [Chloroflexota bacterium]